MASSHEPVRGLSRREFIAAAGVGAVSAVVCGLGVRNAFAGMGAGGSIGGGGGSGAFYGLPFIEWRDSLNGDAQGHTLASNYKYWNDLVRAELRATGFLPVANSRGLDFQMDGPSYIDNSGKPQNNPHAKDAMLSAMKSALARNGVSVPSNETELNNAFAKYHVRIVGVAFVAGIQGSDWPQPGKSTNVPLHQNNCTLEYLFNYLHMKQHPVIDGASKGVGALSSAHGWSDDQVSKMIDTYLKDFRAGNQTYPNGDTMYDFFTWAVSDADLALTFCAHKRSARPDVENDVSGAEYTVFTDQACTKVAKQTDGSNAIGVIGKDGYSQTLNLPRTVFSDAGATQTEVAIYYVRETKGPSNGKFLMDEMTYIVKGDGTLTDWFKRPVDGGFILEPKEEICVGYLAVEKDLVN